jgi:hypothetical protein
MADSNNILMMFWDLGSDLMNIRLNFRITSELLIYEMERKLTMVTGQFTCTISVIILHIQSNYNYGVGRIITLIFGATNTFISTKHQRLENKCIWNLPKES